MRKPTGLKRVRELSFQCYKFQSFDRAMAILKLLANAGSPLDLNEIVDTLGFAKPTAHRYMVTMLRHGLVVRTVKGRYLCAEQLAELLLGNQALTTDH